MPWSWETIRGIATPTTVWSSAARSSAMATPRVARITCEREAFWVISSSCSSAVLQTSSYGLLRNVRFLNRIQSRNQDAEHLRTPAAGSDPSGVAPRMVRLRPGPAFGGEHSHCPQRHGSPALAGLPGGRRAGGGGGLPARRGFGAAAAPARRRRGGGPFGGLAVIGRGRGGGRGGRRGGPREAGAGPALAPPPPRHHAVPVHPA